MHPDLLFGTEVSEMMLGLESQSSVWGDQEVGERARGTLGVRLEERVLEECCLCLSLTWPCRGSSLPHLQTKSPTL